MKKWIKISLIVVASIFSAIGLLFVVGTVVDVRTIDQIKRLISFDYMSFVDSLALGGLNGTANDFFTGVTLLLVSGVVFLQFERTKRIAKLVVGVLFFFVTFALIYACLNPRIGIKPF